VFVQECKGAIWTPLLFKVHRRGEEPRWLLDFSGFIDSRYALETGRQKDSNGPNGASRAIDTAHFGRGNTADKGSDLPKPPSHELGSKPRRTTNSFGLEMRSSSSKGYLIRS
jgi:hypothetical protein